MHLGTKKTALVVLAPSLLPVRVPQRLRKQAAVDLSAELCGGWDVTWARFPAGERGAV